MGEDLLSLVLEQQRQIAKLSAENAELRAIVESRPALTVTELREELGRALAAKPEVGADLTVTKLREAYEPIISTKAKKTQESYRAHLIPTVAHFGDRPVLSIRKSEYVDFRDNERRKQNTQRGEPPSQGTLRQEQRVFSGMISWAVTDGRLARNPLAGLKAPKVRRLKTTVAVADEPKVEAVAHSTMWEMFVVGVDVGMRLNEIRLLEWSWIDLEGAVIHLPAWLTKNREARSPRLLERAVKVLSDRPRMLRCPYVWPNPDTGKPYDDSTIDRWWATTRAEAGLKPAPGERSVRFHSTRHTAATRMSKVASVATVALQLGQTKEVCLSYIHSDDDDLDLMRAEMDRLAAESRKSPQAVTRGVEHRHNKNQVLRQK